MKKICIPFIANSKNEIFDFYEKVKTLKPNLIEIWLDNIEMKDIKEIIESRPFPLIVVCKWIEEKWKFKWSEEERVWKLIEAINNWVDYVDIWYHTDKKLIEKIIKLKIQTGKTKIIISHHNWLQTPKFSTMQWVVEKMKTLNPDIIKFITTANDEFDNISIYRLCENLEKKWIEFISFAMWEKWKQSRIICALLWSKWSYCPFDISKSTAPWQIEINEIKKIWKII